MMDVSIILVNYNTRQLTQNCINSIFRYTQEIDFELILVDNGSTDGSVELFQKDERIILVVSETNLGFGRANNLAYKYACGKYIFLLNSDTLLLNNAVKVFYDYAESHRSENLGALGTTLLDKQKQVIHSFGRFPTPLNSLYFIISSYTRRIGIDVHKWYFSEQRMKASVGNVDYITGADLFIPQVVIEQTGFFDPAFFMYFEETDLQKRMMQQMFFRRIIAGPEIIHLEGASFQKGEKYNLFKSSQYRKSEFLYLKKHSHFLAYVFYRFFLFLLSILPVLCLRTDWRAKGNYLLFLLKG